MFKLFFAVFLALLSLPAFAADYEAVTTTNAVIRQAPGPSYGQIGTIPAGTRLSVDICFNQGAYCMIRWAGEPAVGFVSGDLLTIGETAQTVLDAERAKWAGLTSPKSALTVAPAIVAWGDSLTAGAGVTPEKSYPKQAEALFPAFRKVEVHGFGGKPSTFIKGEFLADGGDRSRTTWFWVGRNNVEHADIIIADLDAMIAALGHKRYLIGNIPNGGAPSEAIGQSYYVYIEQLNAALKQKYGDHLVDVRGALLAAADPIVDAADIKADRVAGSLRSDDVHLNEAGYAVVAKAFEQATVQLGY